MRFIKSHKNDIMLLAAVLLLAAAVMVFSLATRQGGGELVISVDGAELSRHPLGENQTIEIVGAPSKGDPHSENAVTNVLIIEDGAARMQSAACPDHVCINQGKISFEGEMIVCLPNRVVITIEGGDGDAPDIVAN